MRSFEWEGGGRGGYVCTSVGVGIGMDGSLDVLVQGWSPKM